MMSPPGSLVGTISQLKIIYTYVCERYSMSELKGVRKPKRVAPRPARWLLDDNVDEASEPVLDPYAGRFFGDQFDLELDDADIDRIGGSHGLFDF